MTILSEIWMKRLVCVKRYHTSIPPNINTNINWRSMTIPTCRTANNGERMVCRSRIKGNRIPGTFPALSEVIPTQTSLRFQYVSLQLARLRNCVNLRFARHWCDRHGPKMVSGVTKRCEQEIPYREGAGVGGWGGTEELGANE